MRKPKRRASATSLREIGAIGHRALRIRGRGEVDGDRAREQVLAQRIEIGQEAGRRCRRQIDRLATGGDRAGRIGGIERIGDEHGRACRCAAHPAPAASAARNRPSRVPLSTSTSVAGIERARERIAPVEPVRDRFGECVEPLVHRIAAELVEMRGDHRADEGGHRVLRLADRHADRGLSRRRVADQFAQPHERRARVGRARRRGGKLCRSSSTS